MVTCIQAHAMIITNDVDRNNFLYQSAYTFSTSDLAATQTAVDLQVGTGATLANNFYRTVSRDGSVVGISVTGSTPLNVGAATFDITINGTVTGVQTVIEAAPVRTAIGNYGKSDSQFAYMRQDRDETAASRGFRPLGYTADVHNSDNPYGRATPLTAGDRIGVKVTTSSNLSVQTIDYVVTVYVLE